MMPTIRIDDQVWDWLKEHARPFEDTPNSVLRRVAGLDGPNTEESQPTRPAMRRVGRRPGGQKTPQRDFREPLLRILIKHGGKAERGQVLRELERMLAGRLTDFDKSDIESGTIRWQKSAEWEVSTMRQEGLLLPQARSPRGVWCLSEVGERAANELS